MNKTASAFNQIFAKARKRLEYFVQGAMISFTESVVTRMEELNISKTELAGKLKCKPSYISKALGGGTNFTLESMVKIGLALDAELEVKLTPKGCSEKLEDVLHNVTRIKPLKQATFDWAVSRGNMIQLPPATKRYCTDDSAFTITA